jgi:hypothetical protein
VNAATQNTEDTANQSLAPAVSVLQVEPEQDCVKGKSRYSVVHVARIKKAATLDSQNATSAAEKRTR